ncbi:MAG: MBL fold metallo-hydrolase [Erysipelotrichaceae bacterium]|nr:MBL fold metallo-hydrolase [Erysipelotrichaceae bacterium]
MKLKVLVDNNTYIDQYYLGEPAISFYIEEGGKKILFDTGYSDVYIRNAKMMNIDLNGIDYLVLSHGHNDHTGGLRYFKDLSKTSLIAHNEVFEERVYEGLEVGSPVTLNELKVKEFVQGNELIKITDKLYFLGEIKRRTDFENRPVGILKRFNKPDYLKDDSALVYKSDKGLFIITGCSHSGICNIILDAKEKLKEDKVYGIIGGLHLLENNEQLARTIEFLQNENIEVLYPSHCVSLEAKHLLFEVSKVKEVGVGLEIEI